MATVYITANNRWAALYWKRLIEACGHFVMSTWHDRPLVHTSEWTVPAKVTEADETTNLIEKSNFLLVISDLNMVPGGKFVDAGIMIGNRGRVILVGRQENLKMFNSRVTQVDTEDDVRRILCNAEYEVPAYQE